mmetsp:Transcript_87365/g.154906  ORF Transcript_87365/g.154906 Transcript_87365/m.154906 type:complete len:212 (+) Transcript_87365:388-1023(+)
MFSKSVQRQAKVARMLSLMVAHATRSSLSRRHDGRRWEQSRKVQSQRLVERILFPLAIFLRLGLSRMRSTRPPTNPSKLGEQRLCLPGQTCSFQSDMAARQRPLMKSSFKHPCILTPRPIGLRLVPSLQLRLQSAPSLPQRGKSQREPGLHLQGDETERKRKRTRISERSSGLPQLWQRCRPWFAGTTRSGRLAGRLISVLVSEKWVGAWH